MAAEPSPLPAAATAEKALSFLSRGWREVRDSAGADLRLMRARADSFRSLADRELENFLNSASSPFSPPPPLSSSIAELEFLKRIRPKLSELRSAYSSPRLGIDLSAIRSALKPEAGVWDLDWERRSRGRSGRRRVSWKWGDEEEEEGKEWDPLRMLKSGMKELERKSQSSEIFGGFKNSEFVEKVKLSLGPKRSP